MLQKINAISRDNLCQRPFHLVKDPFFIARSLEWQVVAYTLYRMLVRRERFPGRLKEPAICKIFVGLLCRLNL